jgi:hypothetical protein
LEHPIHLSVVATSRNDNHGGYLTQRMQHFVDGFVAQCKRHHLRAELILVEWNPPADRVPLAEELKWPQDLGPCEIRIVTVPREMHAQLRHGDKLPLFQMIAKNVGVRRARGRYVLATNIDILFSDAVVVFMRDRLEPGCLYRADRLDVPTELPAGATFEEILRFCAQSAFRLHTVGFTLVKKEGRWHPRSVLAAAILYLWRSAWHRSGKPTHSERAPSAPTGAAYPHFARRKLRGLRSTLLRKMRSGRKFLAWAWITLVRRQLFTNACGDFTLLARRDWEALRGYPEWPMYSWHLDSMLLFQAHHSGLRETYIGKEAVVYHIEHSPGSGFTPESSEKLFERLAERGIPCLDWKRDVEPTMEDMRRRRAGGAPAIYFNESGWGYANTPLAEQCPSAGTSRTVLSARASADAAKRAAGAP